MGKICIIPGTRPEIIKMSPVVRACERRGWIGLWCTLGRSVPVMWVGSSLRRWNCQRRGTIYMMEKSDEGAIEYIRYGGM